MLDFKSVCKAIFLFTERNAPRILASFGSAGVVGTGIAGARAGWMSKEILDDNPDATDFADQVKLTWKVWIPVGVMGVTSIACIAGATHLNAVRQAALASAYLISENALADYKEEVLSAIGPNKSKKIEDKILQEKVSNNPVPDEALIIHTGNGNSLCYDNTTGRYFRSSVEALKRSENDINARLLYDNWVSLNDIYEEIGLDPIAACVGEEFGIDLHFNGMLDMQYDAMLATNDEPCIVITINVRPKHMYY